MIARLSTAVKLAAIVERVHGTGHPELTRVREPTQEISRSSDAATTTDLFHRPRSVTNDYAVPSDGCEAFTATYDALRSADEEHANA